MLYNIMDPILEVIVVMCVALAKPHFKDLLFN